MPKRVFCLSCKKYRKLYEGQLCQSCYRTKHFGAPNKIRCKTCNKVRVYYGNGQCKDCCVKAYRATHKKEHAEYERLRRKNKPEQVQRSEEKRAKTRKRINWKQKYHQAWYAANQEKQLKYQVEYRKANAKKVLEWSNNRHAKERSLPDTLTDAQWLKLLEKYNHCCAYCGKPDDNLETDHKTPVSKGGGRTVQNIVPACKRCNRRKKDMTLRQFMRFLAKYP